MTAQSWNPLDWTRPSQIAAGLLLLLAVLGWGLAFSRGGTLNEAREQQRAAQARAGQLEQTLAQERQAAGDLAAITQRREAAERARAEAEAR
ncbi:hypothetical protein, partial [Falsiroseomonas oryziterrae]|uniref:hypothetical protein n=1 Tax=Falsiroseomonas oryziterrae TaxID=2911368 RepID=UPI001F42799E